MQLTRRKACCFCLKKSYKGTKSFWKRCTRNRLSKTKTKILLNSLDGYFVSLMKWIMRILEMVSILLGNSLSRLQPRRGWALSNWSSILHRLDILPFLFASYMVLASSKRMSSLTLPKIKFLQSIGNCWLMLTWESQNSSWCQVQREIFWNMRWKLSFAAGKAISRNTKK